MTMTLTVKIVFAEAIFQQLNQNHYQEPIIFTPNFHPVSFYHEDQLLYQNQTVPAIVIANPIVVVVVVVVAATIAVVDVAPAIAVVVAAATNTQEFLQLVSIPRLMRT